MTRPRSVSRLSIHEFHTYIKENNPRYGGNYDLQKIVQKLVDRAPASTRWIKDRLAKPNHAFWVPWPQFRKQGTEHSLHGLTGVFSTRINVIVVTTSGHHIQKYNPPENIQHTQELWFIYMDLENTCHYLSTTPNMTRLSGTSGLSGNSWRTVFKLILICPQYSDTSLCPHWID
jgi:hypothetical protein